MRSGQKGNGRGLIALTRGPPTNSFAAQLTMTELLTKLFCATISKWFRKNCRAILHRTPLSQWAAFCVLPLRWCCSLVTLYRRRALVFPGLPDVVTDTQSDNERHHRGDNCIFLHEQLLRPRTIVRSTSRYNYRRPYFRSRAKVGVRHPGLSCQHTA